MKMVVNIIEKKVPGYGYEFLGIDGNGIVVLRGGYSYNRGSGIWDGYYRYGTNRAEKNYVVPKSVAEYATPEKLCYRFLRDMLAEEKSIIVNNIVEL